jgi:hypothetical protein
LADESAGACRHRCDVPGRRWILTHGVRALGEWIEHDRSRAQVPGAGAFIEKPVDDSALIAAINRGLTRTFAQQVTHQSGETLTRQFAALTPRQRTRRIGLP